MDVWIRIFAEKLRIIFKVCFRRKGKGRSPKCGEVWRGVERCGGQKLLKMCGHPSWMHVIIMLPTRFGVNPHSKVT